MATKNKIDLKSLTIEEAHDSMSRGDYTARDLAEACLREIEKKNGEINAYLEVYDDVLRMADVADKMFKDGKATLLTGIPLAIKDNILVKGKTASAASKILEKYKATYDATAISKLRDAGAVFIGRANMDEFAMGGSTENSVFGPTRNPYDPERVAGGSSGGSAAAVAMNGALAALGSDTGGSVRQPASFCGVVGLKPTYGAVSRHGLMAMGSSLDQIGPLTKTVRDAEILFNAMRGKDAMDSTTFGEGDGTYKTSGKSSGKTIVVGVPRHFLNKGGLDPAVAQNFDDALAKLKERGCEIVDIELPNVAYSLAVYYVVMPAEVSSNMARFDGVRYGLHVDGKNGIDDYFKTRGAGLGREVRRRILLGTYVLSAGYYDAYYGRANALRALIESDFKSAFEKVDIIVTPTTPTPAFRIGEKTSDPLSMYLEDIFTVTANLTGMPAMSVPSGMVASEDGRGSLPLGVQFTARHGDEAALFAVGKLFLGESAE